MSNDASFWAGNWPPTPNSYNPNYPVIGTTQATDIEYAVVDTPYALADLNDAFLDAEGLTWTALSDMTLAYHGTNELDLGLQDASKTTILRMTLTPTAATGGFGVLPAAREIFQFQNIDAQQVPSLTVWGLIMLGLILTAAALVTLVIRRRANVPA